MTTVKKEVNRKSKDKSLLKTRNKKIVSLSVLKHITKIC